MFLFLIIYICSFLFFLKDLFKGNPDGIVRFIIFGLSIYTVSLSISYLYGYSKINPFFQSFKEIAILSTLVYLLYKLDKKIRFQIVDKLVLAFFIYVFGYILLPLGSYSFFQKILAFKSLCFFPVVYFTGRFMKPEKIKLSETFHFICLLSIAAAAILFFEVITNTHLQTLTGYADYNYYFFDQEPSGSYGLSWTFEIEGGIKRFASLFANPLEYAAATLITVAAIASLVTNDKNRLSLNNFVIISLCCTLLAIIFSLSRASFISYFIMIYTFAYIIRQKMILKFFHYSLLSAICILLFFSIEGDLGDYIINTFQFTNASSIGHVIEWLNGIQAMSQHPLGMGLGESGRISAPTGFNTGGENQFIIIGVQAGLIALLIYILLYIKVVTVAIRTIRNSNGKKRKLAIFVLLIKMGLLIPLFTSETESYIYISYITWFFTGLLINMVSKEAIKPKLSK